MCRQAFRFSLAWDTTGRLLNPLSVRMPGSSLLQNPERLRRAHNSGSPGLSQIEEPSVSGHDEVSTADGGRGEHVGIPRITKSRNTGDLFLVGRSRDDLDSNQRQNLIRRGSKARKLPCEDGGGLPHNVVRHEKGVRAPERSPQQFVLVSTECYSGDEDVRVKEDSHSGRPWRVFFRARKSSSLVTPRFFASLWKRSESSRNRVSARRSNTKSPTSSARR